MNKTISFAILLAALIALSVPAPAMAMKHMSMHQQGEGHGNLMEPGGMGDMMGMCSEHVDKMGLSDDQTAKMKPLHREMQKKHARFLADQKIAEIELAEIMEVKDFDLEQADGAVKKIAGIKTAHHLEMLTTMKEMRTILTEQQYKEMKKMMSAKMVGKKPVKKHVKKHK